MTCEKIKGKTWYGAEIWDADGVLIAEVPTIFTGGDVLSRYIRNNAEKLVSHLPADIQIFGLPGTAS